MDNELILYDRVEVIKTTMQKYGINNFAMSWSGGKDSCVMSALFDLALPNNTIPRIYADTGLDLTIMRDFVNKEREKDNRIVRIAPSVNIKKMLEEEGYPFSSKKHSRMVEVYRRLGYENSNEVRRYLGEHEDGKRWSSSNSCPKCLRYQFSEEFTKSFKPISDVCCKRMKKDPINKWQKENGYKYAIIGVMAAEGGQRHGATCLAFKRGKLKAFQPLAPITKEWEDWFIDKYNVRLCDIYKPPYNYERTGCKGCPFNKYLQTDLDTLEQYFPNDRRQCELIWKPVYDEYRRIGYRLKKTD